MVMLIPLYMEADMGKDLLDQVEGPSNMSPAQSKPNVRNGHAQPRSINLLGLV